MRAASQDSERSCNSSQKDRRATTCKKRHRCLSISVRQRCFTQPACGYAVFLRGSFVQMSEQSCCMSEQSCCVSSGAAAQDTFATRKSFSIFKGKRFRAGCHLLRNSGKEKEQRKGTKKSGKQVKVPISAEFEQKDVMLHLFSQGYP